MLNIDIYKKIIKKHIQNKDFIKNLKNLKNKTVYMFWTGNNKLTPNRLQSIKKFKLIANVNLVLITNKNLKNYILKSNPLHPGYQYLSETQKSDYLRAYFMNFYGGGYSDIKETTSDWSYLFNKLYNSNYIAIGYKEIGKHGVAGNNKLKSKYNELIGCGAYIFKPDTKFTNEWYIKMMLLMDYYYLRLKKNPASFPQDSCEKKTNYPICWNTFNQIFHPLCYKYRKSINRDLPISIFKNYR